MKKHAFNKALKFLDLYFVVIFPTTLIAMLFIFLSGYFFKMDFFKYTQEYAIALWAGIFFVGCFISSLQIQKRYIAPLHEIADCIKHINNGEYAIPFVKTSLNIVNDLVKGMEKIQIDRLVEEKECSGVSVDIISEETLRGKKLDKVLHCQKLKEVKEDVCVRVIEAQNMLNSTFKNLEGLIYAANHRDKSLSPLKPVLQNNKINMNLTKSIQEIIVNISEKITLIKRTAAQAHVISVNATLEESKMIEVYGEQVRKIIEESQIELDYLKESFFVLQQVGETLLQGINSSDDLLKKTLENYQGLNIPMTNMKALKQQICYALENLNLIAADFKRFDKVIG